MTEEIKEIRIFQDGFADEEKKIPRLCAVFSDYVDLLDSPAGFGSTPEKALNDLYVNKYKLKWLEWEKECSSDAFLAIAESGQYEFRIAKIEWDKIIPSDKDWREAFHPHYSLSVKCSPGKFHVIFCSDEVHLCKDQAQKIIYEIYLK